jgi:hypothetical protein
MVVRPVQLSSAPSVEQLQQWRILEIELQKYQDIKIQKIDSKNLGSSGGSARRA